MKKAILIALACFMSIAAMAYDFTGKKFVGKISGPGGPPVTTTMLFRSGGKATLTYSVKGGAKESDTRARWEVSGDFINLMDSTGDVSFLEIGEDEEGIYLLFTPGNSTMVLREAKTAPKKASPAKKRRR